MLSKKSDCATNVGPFGEIGVNFLVQLSSRSHFAKIENKKVIFPDAQWQLTHKSLVGSCRISNPFEILWLSLLPVRINNKSKMKELEWSKDFPHYNPMGAICCHGNQSSDPILPKT